MTTPMLSCAEVRERERRCAEEVGLPTLLLMENAGRGLAELLISLGVAGKVLTCCGKGNNGGDGFVIARHLDNHHVPVHVLLFGHPDGLSPDAALNYQVATRCGLRMDVYPDESFDAEKVRAEMAAADWIVDALFGTGLKGPLRAPFDQVVGLINDSPAKVLAADIPSGLDGDTGQPLGPTVRADHTGTLIAWKKGFAGPTAKEWTGQVHLLDTGMPRHLLAGVR